MNAYKFDFAAKTITITSDFAKALNDPTSGEYAILAQIRKDFPEMQIIRKTHKTPRSYTNQQGEKFNCNQFKNLTYKNMEVFMMGLPNAEDYMVEYLFLKNYASEVQANGYALIRRWFVAQFPDYRKNPIIYLHIQPTVVSATEIAKQYKPDTENAA